MRSPPFKNKARRNELSVQKKKARQKRAPSFQIWDALENQDVQAEKNHDP
jgi:hypothetical protein